VDEGRGRSRGARSVGTTVLPGLDGDDEASRRQPDLPSRAVALAGRADHSAADPVRAYLREIGKIPLLTADEEVELARRVTEGQLAARRLAALEARRSVDGLAASPEAEPQAEAEPEAAAVAAGLEAKAALIRANLRLVVSIAKRYRSPGVALLDLIQEGNLGLMRAVEKFDYHRGFKFSTYATWWIRQAVIRALADQGRTIRIPVHVAEALQQLAGAERQLAQNLGREPRVVEIARQLDLTPERVRELQQVRLETLSLQATVGAGDELELADLLADPSAVLPADAATQLLLSAAIEDSLRGLSAREREILALRFGLDDGQARTLEEVGRRLRVTRERVRQIEAKTLAKLRHPQRAEPLLAYLEDR